MRFLADLYRGETHLDLVRAWRYGVAVSAVLIAISVASFATQGLNLGIDFVGGTTWELPSRGTSVAQTRSALEPFGLEGAKIQTVGGETLRVSADVEADIVGDETDAEVTAAIVEATGVSEGDVRFSRVTGSWEVPVDDTTAEELTEAVSPIGSEDAIVTVDEGVATIQAPSSITEITEALAAETGGEASDVSVSTVGPSWGDEITAQAQRALVFFFIAIALYITIRLEWKMAVGALAAMVHDIVVTVGVYSVFQFEVTPATVIAFLTILGYSLYDTIVVYDKIRENQAKAVVAGRMSYTSMMNLSLNQVLPRSINTTVTSVVPVLSLLVFGAYVLGRSRSRSSPSPSWWGCSRAPTRRSSWRRRWSPGSTSASPATASSASASRPGPARAAKTSTPGRHPASRGSPRPSAPAPAPAPAAVPGRGPRERAAGAGPAPTWSGNHPPRPRKKSKRR
ncbi:MAG: protein translocase subunit SecF [Acidimicrobiia bacterium]|nr:protein translocase subunit SecF [Acidimicrobiia bacterium]